MSTHEAAHYLIFTGYLVAMVGVPWAFNTLVRLKLATIVSGAGFFLFCGLTHVALATGHSDADWVTVTDHLQAVSIWVFAPSLLFDLLGARRRLRKLLSSREVADVRRD